MTADARTSEAASSADAPAGGAPARRMPARDRLLAAAESLFYADGMAATGIDAIIAEAGVAKKSLYNNFASKDELVLAYIEARHAEWLRLYERRLVSATEPLAKVLAVFDAYADHAEAGYVHGFRGCGLLNAAAELPVGHPGRIAVARHKAQVEDIVAGHLGEVGIPDPRSAARHLSFLLEGAMSRAGLESDPAVLQQAKTIAEALLRDLVSSDSAGGGDEALGAATDDNGAANCAATGADGAE